MEDKRKRELQTNFRRNVIDALVLISSAEKQREYQKSVPIAQVPEELFCSWEESYGIAKHEDWFKNVFSDRELKALDEFNGIFDEVCMATPDRLPDIDEFIMTAHWRTLSEAATWALAQMKRNG